MQEPFAALPLSPARDTDIDPTLPGNTFGGATDSSAQESIMASATVLDLASARGAKCAPANHLLGFLS